MKIHIYKFLLSLVRGLVLLKRAIVWFARTFGRVFIWVFKPTVPFLMVPLYNTIRRTARRYTALGDTVSERRMRVAFSEPAALFLILLVMVSVSHAATRAASTSGAIPGARSILYTKLLSKGEADWQGEEVGVPDEAQPTESAPSIVFQHGGSVARVFPYGGIVGRAPLVEEPKTKEQPPVQPIQKYAVQRGDTIAKIAKKFHLKQETVLAANSLKIGATVRAGDVLTIPAVDGVLYTVRTGGTPKDVAKKFGVQPKIIAVANNIEVSDGLSKGQVLLIPGVRPVVLSETKPTPTPVTPKPTPQPVAVLEQPAPEPQQPSGEAPDEVPTEEQAPQPTAVQVAPRAPLSAGEKLFWPTTRHAITQFFSAQHPGVDLDGDYSDQIFAADDGTVVASGWNNSGYGNMILIDHGNGMQTRYGHSSKVFVRIGQEVHRGDVIGMVGTTGRSTGTHLHFEVIIGGRRVNPLKYIK